MSAGALVIATLVCLGLALAASIAAGVLCCGSTRADAADAPL